MTKQPTQVSNNWTPDQGEQKVNKRHRAKKDKLVLKQKFKKNKQKFAAVRSALQQIKKKKDLLRKMGVVSDRFNRKVHADEIQVVRQIVKKLIDHNGDSRDDLPTLFADLDQGSAMDISGIEDEYVQAKLYKIFKIMRLRKSKDNELEFRKKLEKEIHGFSFKKFIEYIIKEVEQDQSSSSNSGVSDSDDQSESRSDTEHTFDAGEFETTLTTIAQNTKASKLGQKRDGVIINQDIIQKAVVTQKIVDMDLGKNFLQDTMGIVKRGDSSSSDENDKNMIADELEAMFSGKSQNKKHSNLKKWNRMDKNERDEAGPEVPDSLKNENIKYLGADIIEEDEQTRQLNQKKIYEDLKNKNGGNESLMEQHKRENNSKGSKPRREFDRKKDLRGSLSMDNSQNKLNMLKNTGELNKRFGNQGKFM